MLRCCLAAFALAMAPLALAQNIPPAEEVGVTLRPEARAVRSLPAGRGLRLALNPLPPGAIDPFPVGRQLRIALTPLAPTPIAALPSGHALGLALPPELTGPEALAPIATASFPTPQPLTVTLVPPASPLAPVAMASYPAPQPLTVTLVPPASPLATIASAKFPAPQPLAVTLYAGEPLTAPTIFAGLAPSLTLAPPVYTVQIVQAIPRRGANFFDRRDPAGQGTAFASGGGGTGGGSPCSPGPTSGGTFQSVIAGPYPRDIECHSLVVVSDPAGQGDVLAMGDFHMIFANPGSSLTAAININSGATFATLTGPNTSTISITGATTAPRGTAPAGTLMRIDGTANPVSPRLLNYTLTVCTAAGPVVYRRADGNCL